MRRLFLTRALALTLLASLIGFAIALTSCQRVRFGATTIFLADVSPRLETTRTPSRIPSGRVISIASSADGMRVYAGTVHGGLWRSNDGGLTFAQIMSAQPGDGEPACPAGAPNPCRLASRTIAAIAVSPIDPNLVFVGTANDRGRPERDGIYRTIDGGQTWQLVHQQNCAAGAGVAGVTNQPVGQIVFAPDDPTKVWAAVGCAVAYSTVGGTDPAASSSDPARSSEIGVQWTPVAASTGPIRAFHVGVSASQGAGQRAVWSCGSGALWYSSDGGRTLVADTAGVADRLRCDAPTGMHQATQTEAHVVAVNPSDMQRAYFITTGGTDSNGFNFMRCTPGQGGCPSSPPAGSDPFAATPCGSLQGCDHGLGEVSFDAGTSAFSLTQRSHPPIIAPVAAGSGGLSLLGSLNSSGQFLLFMVDDRTVHVAVAPADAPDSWHRLDAPDPSAVCSVVSASARTATCPADGTLLPHGDGTPPVPIHVDPHAVAVTPRIEMTLSSTPGAIPIHRTLETCGPTERVRGSSGHIFMSSDGGLVVSTDCGERWRVSDRLSTLVAGDLAGITRRGRGPALYFGGRDNDSWWTGDGGASWQIADATCGDCEGFYTDQLAGILTHRIRTFAPPNHRMAVWSSRSGVPDPNVSPRTDYVRGNVPYADAYSGWLPLILTNVGETPPAMADMIVVAGNDTGTDSVRAVWRNSDGSRWTRQGPALPAAAGLWPAVKASGGHGRTTYYVSDRTLNGLPTGQLTERVGMGERLWRSRLDSTGAVAGWDCIVPGPSAPGVTDGSCAPSPALDERSCPEGRVCRPWSFAVDPYDPRVLYILDNDGIKQSLDSGATWRPRASLTNWLSDGGRVDPPCRWTCAFADSDFEFNGMTFVRGEPGTRFAIGVSGVFMTISGATPDQPDRPEQWHRLLDPNSLACQPTSAFFDSDGLPPRTLYVGCVQRGVLSFYGIPWPSEAARFDSSARSMHFTEIPTDVRFTPGPQPGFDPKIIPVPETWTKERPQSSQKPNSPQ